MTLKEYLEKNSLRMSDLSKELGIKHCIIRRWVFGEAIPSKGYMKKIVKATNGEVMPNDFYEVE